MAQSDAQNWHVEARKEQCEFYSIWGHRVVWSGEPSESKDSLQLMIALHVLFKSGSDDANHIQDLGLSRREIAIVRAISNKMIKYFPDQFVHVKLLYITTHWRGTMGGEIVFKVEGGGQTKIIDRRFRVYHDWDSFLKGNTLAPCEMCFPTYGKYTLAPSGMEVLVSFGSSPSSSKMNIFLTRAKLVAYLVLFVGIIIDAVAAFVNILVLWIVGTAFSFVAVIFVLVLAILNFFDALKYS